MDITIILLMCFVGILFMCAIVSVVGACSHGWHHYYTTYLDPARLELPE